MAINMAAARKSAALAAAAARTVLQQEPAHFGFMACKASAASALSAQPNRALHASASAGNNAIIVGSFAVAAGAIGMRYAMQVSGEHTWWELWHARATRFGPLASLCRAVSAPVWQSCSAAFHVGITPLHPHMPAPCAAQAYEQWSTDPARKHNAMKWHYKGDFEDEMSTSEAAKILGIRESASVDAVRKAHRKLMILNHPDAGGSTYLAGKVNEAKDKLMGKSGQKAKMD